MVSYGMVRYGMVCFEQGAGAKNIETCAESQMHCHVHQLEDKDDSVLFVSFIYIR